MKREPSFLRRFGWLLLIFLTAVFLRFYEINETPPGITHDEADHGITALSIVEGAREIYFTVGYGREPLFDYSTAAVMSLIGPSYLAGRVTAVFFGLILIAGMYAWVRRAFDNRTALLTSMGIAVGFWPVMTSRHSLRSITFPALYVFALTLFWLGLRDRRLPILGKKLSPFVMGGIVLGLTFYTYIPARILWILFPLLAGCWTLSGQADSRRVWRGTAMMLLIGFIVASPLFYYLYEHPEAELRIRQLNAPLNAAFEGEFEPLIKNAVSSLGVISFSGDNQWRYNISGRPFFQPVMGALFYLGLATSVWRLFRPSDKLGDRLAHVGIVSWLVAGLAPALITGPQLSTTQAIGMQPVLYLFPALGLVTLYQLRLGNVRSSTRRRAALSASIVLFASTALLTARDYFVTWANAPEVRVQYETTMVAALEYIGQSAVSSAAISTISPGRFHSPAVAQMVLPEKAESVRWFDGRHSLVLPAENESLLLLPGFTSLPIELVPYWESATLIETLSLRPSDLDRPIDVYDVDGPRMRAAWQEQINSELDELAVPVNFDQVVDFLGYDLMTPLVKPGEVIKFATMWRAKQQVDDAIMFTHLQAADGRPIAQADRLDAPSHAWQAGDTLIQLHELKLPLDAPIGVFPLVVGLCQQLSDDCIRLPIAATGFSRGLLQATSVTVAR